MRATSSLPKLLFVNNLYAPNIIGGAERSVQFLAEALAAKGYPVTVVCLAPQAGTDEQNGVKVRYLKLRNLYWAFHNKDNPTLLKPWWHVLDSYNVLMADKLQQVLQEEQPDLVHTNVLTGFSVAAWTTIKRLGLPLVHTLRDYYLLCPRSKMFRAGRNCEGQCWDCKLYATPRHALSHQVDAVIGISKFILDRHVAAGYFEGSSQHVIHNAYQADVPPVPVPSNNINRPLRVGYLGRLEANKGIEMLLDTVSQLPENVEMYVAGRGHESFETTLKARFPEGPVHYLGFVPPAELFSKIDVLVVPSLWHEPLGRIVFEAYAHGLPVIASARGGISEIVTSGQTGVLFDPDVPTDAPNSLKTQLLTFRTQMDVTALHAQVLSRAQDFLPEVIVAQHERLYEHVLGTPKQVARG